jgi:hypothetical protein
MNSAPIITSKLCAINNTASTVVGVGPWTWTCTPTSGGTPVACSTQFDSGLCEDKTKG